MPQLLETMTNALVVLTEKLNTAVSNGPGAGPTGKRQSLLKRDMLLLIEALISYQTTVGNGEWADALIERFSTPHLEQDPICAARNKRMRVSGIVYLMPTTTVGSRRRARRRELTVILDGRYLTRTDAQGRFEFPSVIEGACRGRGAGQSAVAMGAEE